MNVLILGAGEVGFHIAQRLSAEGNDVAVIDNDPLRLQRVSETMDVRTVLGHASHPSILEQAGAKNADLLIAATTNDETNMLACQIAHSLFKVTTKMARVREPDYMDYEGLLGRDDLPIDLVISPEREAAYSIVKRFQISSSVDVQEFADGKVRLIGIRIQPKSLLAGVSVKELGDVTEALRICITAHEHNKVWKVPCSSTVLLAGDSVYVALSSNDVDAFLALMGYERKTHTQRNVLITGGGNVGYVVAQQLESMGFSPKLIEFDRQRAEWLAEKLSKSVVICGDALDQQLLEEESIEKMDDFLALTNDDETNILGSLIAKKYNVPHIITLVNRAMYTDLVRQIGLNITISPRYTTASAILRHVRKGKILNMSTLGAGALEVLEAEALQTSRILNTPLAEIAFPKQTLIAAIVRKNQVIIPDGASMVQPGDHVIIVTRSKDLRAVEKLFEVNLEFF
ncbi:MAG: Trk system potassium transporter TrkA [Zetaproteobacteria bacterium]|nr:Trk system potassium transporter TrkA [Zetaproteobacteria bacterium]